MRKRSSVFVAVASVGLAILLGGCAGVDDGTWGGKPWFPAELCPNGSVSTHCDTLSFPNPDVHPHE